MLQHWCNLIALLVGVVTCTANGGVSPNQLLHRSRHSLKNEYYILRHGQSEANVAKLIASSPTVATQKYGLSPVGKEQAAQAGQDVLDHVRSRDSQKQTPVLLLASDLKRAKETAEIVRDKLEQAGIPLYEMTTTAELQSKKKGLIVETRLRERWFGEWDETSDTNYPNVWKDDAVDPNHTLKGVESVNQVMERTTQCIAEWDDKVEQPCIIICVAHGDVLQILQTAFCKLDGSKHRTMEHLETAKLRKLQLKD